MSRITSDDATPSTDSFTTSAVAPVYVAFTVIVTGMMFGYSETGIRDRHIAPRTTRQDFRPHDALCPSADLICTIKLAESKLSHGEPLNYDESRIFRGPRIFKHDILRSIKHKGI